MKKEQRQILQRLDRAGWRIERRARHFLCFPPGGGRAIIIGTPSDHRTVSNMVSNIERLDPSLKGQIKVS